MVHNVFVSVPQKQTLRQRLKNKKPIWEVISEVTRRGVRK